MSPADDGGAPSRFLLAPVVDILRQERDRTVPVETSRVYYLGALLVIFFLLEIATGILLMIYYRPSAGAAYYSTGIIMDEVRLGWLLRSVHRWGADLVILLGFLYVIRVYFWRGYQPPRQLNWVLGIVLLILVLTLGFTGTLLPWDQYAYWYTDSARETISAVPVLGNFILGVIWGGWDIGEEVLLRFYALHVGALPWLAASLLLLHVVLVWRFGITEPTPNDGPSRRGAIPFFPDFLVNLFIAALLLAGLLLSVAVFAPPSLLARADPLSPLSHLQPRWYLLPVRELLRALPGPTAALSVMGFLLLLLLVPVIDGGPTPWRSRKIIQPALGWLVVGGWVLLGVLGYLR
jgi:quinol-cytochrome oxidoreductase complex cytochrome b subunit